MSHYGSKSGSGRLPKSVYVRRRIAVLAGLLAVIFALVMIIAGPATIAAWFGVGSSASPTQNDAPPTQEQDQEQEQSQSQEEPQEPQIGPCAPADLAVEAVTDEVEYFDGEYPELSLRVTNHGPECDADLGTETMKFTITSGSELYWDSTDCQVDASSNLVRLKEGQTLETEAVVWDRTRSNPATCDEDREGVPSLGDSYHLTVEISGVESTTTKQFLLY